MIRKPDVVTDSERYLKAAKIHIERVLATLELPETCGYNPGLAAQSIEQATAALIMARVTLPRPEDVMPRLRRVPA